MDFVDKRLEELKRKGFIKGAKIKLSQPDKGQEEERKLIDRFEWNPDMELFKIYLEDGTWNHEDFLELDV